MNFKKITIAGFIVVLGLVAYLIWKNMNKPDTDALVSGNGRIEATEINVSSKLSGQLEEILVKEGDFVEPGQILARVKISTLEAQLRELEAQQRQAQDAIATAEAQVAMRISEKAAAEAMVQQRETELMAAKNRLARTEVLAKEGASSKQQLDDERASAQQVAAVLAQLKHKCKVRKVRSWPLKVKFQRLILKLMQSKHRLNGLNLIWMMRNYVLH